MTQVGLKNGKARQMCDGREPSKVNNHSPMVGRKIRLRTSQRDEAGYKESEDCDNPGVAQIYDSL